MKKLNVIIILAVVIFGCKKQADQPVESTGKNTGKPPEQLAESGEANEELDKTIDALIQALNSNDAKVVVDAADVIETLGPDGAGAGQVLASKLDDPQPGVRMACMHALQAIGEPAVPFLLEAYRNGPGGAPIRATSVLGNIGPAAKAAVPELRKGLQDKPENLHSWIKAALAKIEGSAQEDAAGEPRHVEKIVLPPQSPLTADQRGWPQFHGPNRDSRCPETGLNTDWKEKPPALLWKLEGLGTGYSSLAITDDKIFTMGDRHGDDGKTRQFVLAFDLQTRKELWAAQVGPRHKDGPRSTPTVDGELLYAIGTEGDLVCLETATGAERWRKSFPNDFGGKMMSRWMFSESPLVDGSKLICTPGGAEATLVALDKKAGDVIWTCAVPALGKKGNDGAGYASALVAEIDGVRQYVQLIGRGLVGVEAESGEFLWGYNAIANRVANIPMPVIRGRYVFTTTDYNTGSALLRISLGGESFHVEELYTLKGRQFENHHGGIVCVGNYVYGGHGNSSGAPRCVDVTTGKIMWQSKAPEKGSASVLYADGHLWFRYDRGLIALIEATPEAYRLKGTFMPILPEKESELAWAHPVIVRGRLYLRHDNLLACYDVRAR